MKQISIAKDFSRYPAGRFLTDGPFSGERFRTEFLVPNLESGTEVLVDLDGVAGYGSSFLEEAFGGAIRVVKARIAHARKLLQVTSTDDSLVQEVNSYIEKSAAL